MIHPLDDYPLHQTSQPMSHVATDSPNAYDRFFFNGYDRDGAVFFAVACGVYPNRGVMDAAFSVVRHGVQYNVRASRACPGDRTATTVGPVQVEIVEPMRRHRIVVDDRHGVAADLTMTAHSPVIEEPRFVHQSGHRTVFDYTRLTQFGRWQGWIDVDGDRVDIDALAPVVGTRDRSWGVRPVGERPPGPPSVPQFFWLWAPTVFADACTYVAVNHESDGRAWHQSGAVVPVLGEDDHPIDPGRVQRGESATFDLHWQPGTRWAERLTTRLGVWGGDAVEIAYEPFLRFQMSGIGYQHPVWRHGSWIGPDESTRDEIALDDVNPADPTMIHIQALSRARWGDRTGVGVVEQLVIGPHEPTGLTGLLDGAP
ncbi:MAG: hypothetical protein QNJ12_03195 [Ilumatobacter sp.]|uniref:hypothetical protein n=1 Tax=Ilumatobacter sp. TaxID=1967498 RepID=UPI00260A6178|nr:hypothetical protein [Ilumatobacter sp.]MDJ0767766.1 hypothetical protein [Ilumatobacter sp.]